MIVSFNKQNLATIRNDLNAALAEVAKKHGLDLSVGSISFGENQFSAKLIAATKSSDSEDTLVVSTKWKVDFLKQCRSYEFRDCNIKEVDFGSVVKIGNQTFTIVGANARKLNVILQDSNGKNYSYPVTMVKK